MMSAIVYMGAMAAPTASKAAVTSSLDRLATQAAIASSTSS